MQHVWQGILVVILCIFGYYFSWKYFHNEKFKFSLFLILLCGLLLRSYMGSDHYLHEWDEKYHALVAKNLIKHPLIPTLYDNTIIKNDYKEWIGSNIWLAKPPVPLWAIATSMYILGTNEIAVRFPSLVISLLAIYLTYLIGCKLFNNKVGILAAFLYSINGIVLELAGGKLSSDHIETFFDVNIEIAILLCIVSIIKKSNYSFAFLCGIFTGLAILSKWLPALIVIPVWLIGAICSGKYTLKEIFLHFIIIMAGCFIIAFPWFIYILNRFPQEAHWVIKKFLFAYSETAEGHNAPFWYYLNYVEIIFGEIVYIPLIFAIYYMLKNKKEWAIKLLSAWWLIPVIIFSFAETKRHTYLMLAAPSIFLITAWYWFYLQDAEVKKKFKWLKILILALLIILPVRFSIERMKPFNRMEMNPIWAKNLRDLNSKIKEKKVVIFNAERPIETMFYTNFPAYGNVPDSITINKFISNGYIPYIYKNGLLLKFDLKNH